MERKPVSSSNIKSVGYDADTRTLEVEFKTGSVYQYSEVPKDLADKMVRADSVGGFFTRNVRNAFQATKVSA